MNYKDLHGVIPHSVWNKFSFDEYYNGELDILKPYMESIGYSDIRFSMGERDSFGPLSRVVHATYAGNREVFVYG